MLLQIIKDFRIREPHPKPTPLFTLPRRNAAIRKPLRNPLNPDKFRLLVLRPASHVDPDDPRPTSRRRPFRYGVADLVRRGLGARRTRISP